MTIALRWQSQPGGALDAEQLGHLASLCLKLEVKTYPKPGLVSHVLAIEDSIARRERGYDFLAGGAGHKSHLANREHAMKWIAIGRDSSERHIEAKLRGAKRMLQTIATNLPKKTAALYSAFRG